MILENAYIEALERDEPEEVAVEVCSCCGTDLYAGEQVVKSLEYGTFYCDEECFVKEMHFKDVAIKEAFFCTCCDIRMTKEYEAFKDKEGNHFCSKSCFIEEYMIKEKILNLRGN